MSALRVQGLYSVSLPLHATFTGATQYLYIKLCPWILYGVLFLVIQSFSLSLYYKAIFVYLAVSGIFILIYIDTSFT